MSGRGVARAPAQRSEELRKLSLMHSVLQNELNVKTTSLESAASREQDHVAEKQRLVERIAELERDHDAVVARLQSVNAANEQRIRSLGTELSQTLERFEREKLALADTYEKRLAQLQAELGECQRELEERNEERAAIDKWRKLRDKMVLELSNLKADVEERDRRHKDDLLDLRRQQELERRKWELDRRDELARVLRDARRAAEDQIDTKIKHVVRLNEELQRAREVQERRTAELTRQNESLTARNAALARDRELADLLQQENARRSQAQTAAVASHARQVAALEHALSAVVSDFDSERTALLRQTAGHVDSVESEVRGLRHLLDLKQSELAQIKSLARSILAQRTELEAFLLSSLDAVKAEIRSRAAAAEASARVSYDAQFRAATRGEAPFPAVRARRPALALARRAARRPTSGPASPASPAATFVTESYGSGSGGGGSGVGGVGGIGDVSGGGGGVGGVGGGGVGGGDDDGGGGGSGDECSASGSASSAAVATAAATDGALGDVDVRRLSWEDRETVLRLLIAKLNVAGGSTPAPAAQLATGSGTASPVPRALAASPYSVASHAAATGGALVLSASAARRGGAAGE